MASPPSPKALPLFWSTPTSTSSESGLPCETVFHGSVVSYGDLAAGTKTKGTFIAADKGVDLFANLIKLRDVLKIGAQADVSSNGVRQQWFEQYTTP